MWTLEDNIQSSFRGMAQVLHPNIPEISTGSIEDQIVPDTDYLLFPQEEHQVQNVSVSVLQRFTFTASLEADFFFFYFKKLINTCCHFKKNVC